jgi:hypothetical protein
LGLICSQDEREHCEEEWQARGAEYCQELIKLQQDVELAIDHFFVNKHIFFTRTYSTKICFTMVTYLAHRTKTLLWEALLVTNKMYLLHGFSIVVIVGDHKFASLSELVVQLPTAPKLD